MVIIIRACCRLRNHHWPCRSCRWSKLCILIVYWKNLINKLSIWCIKNKSKDTPATIRQLLVQSFFHCKHVSSGANECFLQLSHLWNYLSCANRIWYDFFPLPIVLLSISSRVLSLHPLCLSCWSFVSSTYCHTLFHYQSCFSSTTSLQLGEKMQRYARNAWVILVIKQYICDTKHRDAFHLNQNLVWAKPLHIVSYALHSGMWQNIISY